MSYLPDIDVVHGKTTARCSVCEVQLQPDEMVIAYVHSAFRSKVSVRKAHIMCWLKTTKKMPSSRMIAEVKREKFMEVL